MAKRLCNPEISLEKNKNVAQMQCFFLDKKEPERHYGAFRLRKKHSHSAICLEKGAGTSASHLKTVGDSKIDRAG